MVGVYVPNCGVDLKWSEYRTKEWDVDFRQYLIQLQQRKPVIVAGDFNVAHTSLDVYDGSKYEDIACHTPAEREQFSELLKAGFTDTFRQLHPTDKKYSFWDLRDHSRS